MLAVQMSTFCGQPAAQSQQLIHSQDPSWLLPLKIVAGEVQPDLAIGQSSSQRPHRVHSLASNFDTLFLKVFYFPG